MPIPLASTVPFGRQLLNSIAVDKIIALRTAGQFRFVIFVDNFPSRRKEISNRL